MLFPCNKLRGPTTCVRGHCLCQPNYCATGIIFSKCQKAKHHNSGSCKEFGCNADYVSTQACQCNEGCDKYSNCCPDYKEMCWSVPEPTPPPPQNLGTCEEFGCTSNFWSYFSRHPCQCYEGCENEGNCCADYKETCQSKPSQAPWPSPTPQPTQQFLPPGSTVDDSGGQYWSTGDRKTMSVFHQTSPEVCDLILGSNFHIGSGGLCGKAIYFAQTPEATRTKAITASSHGGCMIEATVEVGKQGLQARLFLCS